jgi:hypothetical protein
MATIAPLVIIPSQVEAWISGVSHVEIASDKTVSLFYEDHSQVSAKLGIVSHALQQNFLALVRTVQNAAKANGQRLYSMRLA